MEDSPGAYQHLEVRAQEVRSEKQTEKQRLEHQVFPGIQGGKTVSEPDYTKC